MIPRSGYLPLRRSNTLISRESNRRRSNRLGEHRTYDGNAALGLLTGPVFDSLITLEGEWHELETKREKARKRKKEAAG